MDFTVGGTCDSATAKVAKAKRQLRQAKKKLKAGREAGDDTKVLKKKVKKAKKKLKAAKEDREALC